MIIISDVSFHFGVKEKLKSFPVTDGSINVTTDTEELFVDLENKRIPLTKPVSAVLVAQEKLENMENIKVWFKVELPPKLSINKDPIQGGSINSDDKVITDQGTNDIILPGVEDDKGNTIRKDELELICPEGVTGSIDENGKIHVTLPTTRYDEEYTVIIKNKTTGSELPIVIKYTASPMPNFSVEPIEMIRTNQGTTQIVNKDGSRVYGEDFVAKIKSPVTKAKMMQASIQPLTLGDNDSFIFDDGDNVISIDPFGKVDVTAGLLGGDIAGALDLEITRKDGEVVDVPITYEPKPGIGVDSPSKDVEGTKDQNTTVNIGVSNSDGSDVDMSEIEISGLPDGVTAEKGENGNITLNIPPWGEDKSFTITITNGYKSEDVTINYEAPKKPTLSATNLTISGGNTSGVITVTNSDSSAVDMNALTISGVPSGVTTTKSSNGQITVTVPSSWTTNQNFTLTIANEYSSCTSSVTYIAPSQITTSNSILTLNEVNSGTINISNVDGTAIDMNKISITGLPTGVIATKGTNGNITITVPSSWTTNQTFAFYVSNGVNTLTFTGKYIAPVQAGNKEPDLTLSQGRLWMDRAYAGGNVFLGGGTTNGSTKVSTVDMVTPSLVRTTVSSLTQRADQVCGSWNANYALFAGGFLGQAGSWGSSDAVSAYNSSGTKTTPASLDSTTSDLMGARCGETGRYALLVNNTNGYLYNSSLSKFPTSAAANTNGGQNGGYGATIGNYAIVGNHGSGKMCAYNSSGSKTSVSDVTGSNFVCAAENDNYACFISGNNINRYNASLVKSTVSNFGTSANQGHAIAGKGSNFIVTGGANSGGITYNYAHIINSSGVATSIDSLTQARWNHQGATVGNYAIFAGGNSGTGTVTGYSSIDVYTI